METNLAKKSEKRPRCLEWQGWEDVVQKQGEEQTVTHTYRGYLLSGEVTSWSLQHGANSPGCLMGVVCMAWK